MMILATLALAGVQLSDFSAAANAALIVGNWTTPAYDFQASQVVVPAGHHVISGGGTWHVPKTASWGCKLAGSGASASDLVLVCDAGLSSPVDVNHAPTLPNGFVLTPGTRLSNCVASWFHDGFYSSGSVGTGLYGESYLRDCHALNCLYAGVEWQGPSDSFIDGFVAANSAGGLNGAPLGRYGILIAGGGAGYVSNSHAWGSWAITASLQADNLFATGLTLEGGRNALLRLVGNNIQVKNAWLFSPVGSSVTAIVLGTQTLAATGCAVEARFGAGSFVQILGHINDAAGNSYALTGTSQPVNLGPSDK